MKENANASKMLQSAASTISSAAVSPPHLTVSGWSLKDLIYDVRVHHESYNTCTLNYILHIVSLVPSTPLQIDPRHLPLSTHSSSHLCSADSLCQHVPWDTARDTGTVFENDEKH